VAESVWGSPWETPVGGLGVSARIETGVMHTGDGDVRNIVFGVFPEGNWIEAGIERRYGWPAPAVIFRASAGFDGAPQVFGYVGLPLTENFWIHEQEAGTWCLNTGGEGPTLSGTCISGLPSVMVGVATGEQVGAHIYSGAADNGWSQPGVQWSEGVWHAGFNGGGPSVTAGVCWRYNPFWPPGTIAFAAGAAGSCGA
jgi:hypothetical protein